MDDFSDDVMVALLPTTTDWCKIDLAHLTLVYCGIITDLRSTAHNELAKSALSFAIACAPFTLDVLGIEVLGEDDDKVDTYLLRPTPELIAMREVLNVYDVGKYRFKPHVTIGPVGSANGELPVTLTFDRIMVAWGKEQLSFQFVHRESVRQPKGEV